MKEQSKPIEHAAKRGKAIGWKPSRGAKGRISLLSTGLEA
jgi:hypothetical protein